MSNNRDTLVLRIRYIRIVVLVITTVILSILVFDLFILGDNNILIGKYIIDDKDACVTINNTSTYIITCSLDKISIVSNDINTSPIAISVICGIIILFAICIPSLCYYKFPELNSIQTTTEAEYTLV